MIPQRLAIKRMKDIKITALNKRKVGWLLRNQIIWYKPNHMPSPAKSRFTNTYEPIYFFTRDDWERKVYFDIDSIRIAYKSEDLDENNFDLRELFHVFRVEIPLTNLGFCGSIKKELSDWKVWRLVKKRRR